MRTAEFTKAHPCALNTTSLNQEHEIFRLTRHFPPSTLVSMLPQPPSTSALHHLLCPSLPVHTQGHRVNPLHRIPSAPCTWSYSCVHLPSPSFCLERYALPSDVLSGSFPLLTLPSPPGAFYTCSVINLREPLWQ